MPVTHVSTAYLGTALIPAVSQAQTQLSQLEIESTTGEYADLGLQLGDQSGYELSLRNQDDLLQTLTANNSIASTALSTTQSVLTSLTADAQTAAEGLATARTGSNSAATMQSLGQTALEQLIAGANTTEGDLYVFGGINSQTAPLDDYFSAPTSVAKTAID